jgi:hypothetical protein
MLKVILFLPFKIILSPAHFAFHLVLVRPFGQINYLHSLGFNQPGWLWVIGAPFLLWNVYLGFGIFWQLIFTIQWIFTKKIEGENFFFTYDYQNRK